jgi:hypothetical protein
MSPGAAGDNEPYIWLLAEGAIRHLQLNWANSTFAAGGTTRGMKWVLRAPVSINGNCYAP